MYRVNFASLHHNTSISKSKLPLSKQSSILLSFSYFQIPFSIMLIIPALIFLLFLNPIFHYVNHPFFYLPPFQIQFSIMLIIHSLFFLLFPNPIFHCIVFLICLSFANVQSQLCVPTPQYIHFKIQTSII